jgi:hypothetical protein
MDRRVAPVTAPLPPQSPKGRASQDPGRHNYVGAKQRCEQWNLTLSTCEVWPRGTNGNPAPKLFVILDGDVPHLDSTATRKCWPHLRSVGSCTPRRTTSLVLAVKDHWLDSSRQSASPRLDFGACPFGCKEA